MLLLAKFFSVVLCRRRVRGKRRHPRYAVLDDDDDKLESMDMLPKGGAYVFQSYSKRTWSVF